VHLPAPTPSLETELPVSEATAEVDLWGAAEVGTGSVGQGPDKHSENNWLSETSDAEYGIENRHVGNISACRSWRAPPVMTSRFDCSIPDTISGRYDEITADSSDS
jgi:hypothetical protein